jgi:predicted DCC family thiol-disulfide oxidoreductase YuxK
MGEDMPTDSRVELLYDAECPLCDAYCKAVRLHETAGALVLVDARQASGVKDELTRRGLDVDQGMALRVGGDVYYGSDAIHKLSRMSSRSGLFNRITYWTFNSSALARVLYPLLRGARNLLLKAMCRTKINNLGLPNNQRF